jgi:hypothetical protein
MTFPIRSTLAWLALAMPGFMPLAAMAQRVHPAAEAVDDTGYVLDVPLADGDTQRILYVAPPHPRATLVMLPGGAGDVGLERDGDIRHDHNFVVRTRAAWVARGYAVLIPDALDHENLRGLRSSPGYARLVAALVSTAHDRARGPVFLLGTSQGSIAAMNGAAHAAPGSIAGVVLTESVSVVGGSHETVFDADPAAVRVPALVVANRDDACSVAPPGDAPRIVAAMSHSPDARLLEVSGGTTASRRRPGPDADTPRAACGSLTPHGYHGIEDEVVASIAAWLDAHAR